MNQVTYSTSKLIMISSCNASLLFMSLYYTPFYQLSMGGGISTLFAGAFPELVDKLVLIEGFGPVSKEPSTAVATMRKALDEEAKFHQKEITIGGGKLYNSVNEAVSLK